MGGCVAVAVPGHLLQATNIGDTCACARARARTVLGRHAPDVDPTGRYIWLRIMAIIVGVLGYYYWVAACSNNRSFMSASVAGRIFFFVGTLFLVLVWDAPWILVLFGGVDALCGVLLHIALRAPARGPRAR